MIPPFDAEPAKQASYTVHGYAWQVLDHWQTLITGLLALCAAGATIWATIHSANREVAASNRQLDEARRTERRQLAREGYAFMAMVNAAMLVMLEEIDIARRICERGSGRVSREAREARGTLTRTGLQDLRTALVRQGGTMAVPFLRLDQTAVQFLSKVYEAGSEKLGLQEGIQEELQQLEALAKSLRSDATAKMKACLDVLIATEVAGAGS